MPMNGAERSGIGFPVWEQSYYEECCQMQHQISKVTEPSRELPVAGTADVVVAGGGPAGFAAAIASARAGAKTILLEEKSFLGGVATAVMMTALVCSPWANGIALEIMDLMAKKGGAVKWEPEKRKNGTTPFDAECFKECALEMCLDAGVELHLYTRACAPVLEAGRAKGVIVESKAGRTAFLGDIVIDCTGDADLAFMAGAPVYKGRETDNKMRPFALLFQVGGLDIEKIAAYTKANPDQLQPQHTHDTRHKIGDEEVITRISGFYDLVEKAKAAGELYDGIHYFRLETLWVNRGIAICNTTRIYNMDGTDPADLTKGEIIGRQQIKKLIDFARKYIPGCENAYIISVAPAMGVRETRRIKGEVFLSTDDAINDRHFDDAIMTFRIHIPPVELMKELDVHMPEPIEGSDLDLIEKHPDRVPAEPHEFQVPYRALVPRNVGGMLVAGKTLSVSHYIDGHTRNMVSCMHFGQAAGAAAALCAKKGCEPVELEFALLKDALIQQGYTRF